MVQRTGVRGISQQGRAATGVRVMNVRDEDRVSAVALVVESEAATAAQVTDADLADGPVELSADSGDVEGPVGDGHRLGGADVDDADAGDDPGDDGPRAGGDGRDGGSPNGHGG